MDDLPIEILMLIVGYLDMSEEDGGCYEQVSRVFWRVVWRAKIQETILMLEEELPALKPIKIDLGAVLNKGIKLKKG